MLCHCLPAVDTVFYPLNDCEATKHKTLTIAAD
jgi:hypothetical protein